MSPGINARTGLGADGLRGLWSPDIDDALSGYLDLQLLTEHDGVAVEIVLEPELPRNQGLRSLPMGFVFENITDTQALDRDVFFPKVAVKGGAAGNFRIQILNILWGRNDGTAIGLANPDIVNLYSLCRRLKWKG